MSAGVFRVSVNEHFAPADGTAGYSETGINLDLLSQLLVAAVMNSLVESLPFRHRLGVQRAACMLPESDDE
jgi:hypothetical protein